MRKLLLLVAIAALASCSNDVKDVASSVEPSYDGTVDFAAVISSDTRVSYDPDAFTTGDEILVEAFESGVTFGEQTTYVFDGSSFTCADAITRESETQMLSYIAAYPGAGITGFGESFEFTVKSSQNEANNFEMSDLLVSTLDANTSTTPTLIFDHALSSLVVNFDGDDLEGGTLTINAKATTAIDLATATYVATDAEAVSLTAAATSDLIYKVIFAPQTIYAGETVATYDLGDGSEPYVWTANNDLTFVSGSRYTFTWSIDTTIVEPDDPTDPTDPYNGTVTFDAEISDWIDAELIDEPVANPTSYAVGDYYPNSTNPVGIVFSVDETGTSGKVMWIHEEEGVTAVSGYQWSTEQVLIGADDGYNGRINTATLYADGGNSFAKYPIFNYIHETLNGGKATYADDEVDMWYLPAIGEIKEWFASMYGWTVVYDGSENADDYTLAWDPTSTSNWEGVMKIALDVDSYTMTTDEMAAYNEKIEAAGGTAFLWTKYLAGSTELSSTHVRNIYTAKAGLNSVPKTNTNLYWRPIMAFSIE